MDTHKEALKERIKELYISGIASTKIPNILSIPYTTVRSMLDRAGIQKRPKNCFNGYLGYRKYTINENYFEKIDSYNKAYILGMIFTDGHLELDNNQYNLVIGLAKKDIDLLEYIKIELGSNKPISQSIDTRYAKPRYKVTLKLSSKKLVTDLLKYGLTQNKTFTVKWPTLVNDIYLPSFVLGCLDGDGCWSGSDTHVTFYICSASFDFCNSIKGYLESNLTLPDNKIITYTKYKNDKLRKSPLHRISYCGFKNSKLLYDFLYKDSTIWLERKRSKIESILNTRK